MKKINATLLVTTLALTLGLTVGCSPIPPSPNPPPPKPLDALLPSGVTLKLPRNLLNTRAASRITDAGAVVLTVVNGNEIYLNRNRVQRDQLGAEIKRLVPAGASRGFYLVADVGIGYALFEEIRDLAQKAGVQRFELVAYGKADGDASLHSLTIDILPAPDTAMVRPNPLTLVVRILQNRTLRLNQEDSGYVDDIGPLSDRLKSIFADRKEKRVYRVGSSTETESSMIIHAEPSVSYGDVVKVVDTLKGAGGDPIISRPFPKTADGDLDRPPAPPPPRVVDLDRTKLPR